MKISVIGCGRWGSFIAWYLDSIGHEVTLYGRRGSGHMAAFEQTRTNGLVTLPQSLKLGYDTAEACGAEVIVVSVGAQNFRSVAADIAKAGFKGDIALCMKGIETGTGKRLTEIAGEYLPDNDIGVWIGPGHVQEFTAGIPNCMVIDGTSDRIREKLVREFSSPLIRFYYGYDLIGNEVGAAAKNVIGIAAGVLDGLGLTNLKGALMARGTREVARLIAAMGGNEQSAYGLCHLGDYQATVFSQYSHNRAYGEALVRGTPFEELAEGCYTVEALMLLKEKYGVDMPISAAVHNTIYGGASPREEVNGLFMRSLKKEF